MRVYNNNVGQGSYWRYTCDCGARLNEDQKFCHECGAKQDWSKIDAMIDELDRRSTKIPWQERVKYEDKDGDIFVSNEEV